MFNTIKSRISVILATITVVFFAVIFFFCYTYFNESEKLILNNYDHVIAEISQKLNKNIVTVEHNASDLATVGNSHFEGKLAESTVKQYLTSNLTHYQEPTSVGLWYKPYSFDKKQKLHYTNGVRNQHNDIVFDDEIYQRNNYDYSEQEWYKQIISNVTPKKNVVWTLSNDAQNKSHLLVTAGAGIYSKGQLVGISTVDWDFDACIDIMRQIKPTPNSFTLFADKKHNFVFFLTDPYMDSRQAVGMKLSDIPWYRDNLKDKISFKYHNTDYVPFIDMLDNDMMLIVNVPKMEMLGTMYIKVFLLLAIMGLLSGSLISLLYISLNNNVLNPINKLITIANKISSGSDVEIKIEKPEEFALLASTYDKMTNSIKEITRKQTKMNYELSIANSIQISSLPSIFPPFPEHKEFAIYAKMIPAKEVGGDFYDFYFIDPEHFMFLVADVSGKGIPAALFMMTVKTLINNLSQTISSPKELIETVNHKLCINNKEGFFVTMFACIININTGEMNCINCGHNMPLLRRNDGKYEYLNIEPNIVLGAFDKAEFEIYNTTLNAGDSIFLYTDGITEATNPDGKIYGEQRLSECLNSIDTDVVPVDTTINEVKENVKEFTQGYIQSDDLTMLLFQYHKKVRTFEKPALKENYNDFKTWLHTTCSEWSLNDELSNKLDMCGEEIFANICFHAYPNEVGNIKVSMEKNEKELIMMIFEDNGIVFNPLEKPDPDLTISPKERKLGGLGIFMVKKMANEVKYHRINNRNVLSLKFKI